MVVAEVAADQDADIIEFEALGGMDAADLLERARIDCPDLVAFEVPLCLEAVFERNIDVAAAVLDVPVVAVAGNHAGLVVDRVEVAKGVAHGARIVEDADVKVQVGEVDVNGLAELEDVVNELDVLVAAVAAELGAQDGVVVHYYAAP